MDDPETLDMLDDSSPPRSSNAVPDRTPTGLSPKSVLDALPAAAFVTDATGAITYFNAAAAALWGQAPPFAAGQWPEGWRLLQQDASSASRAGTPAALQIEEPRMISGEEIVAQRPDGSKLSLLVYATPQYDKMGEFIGTLNLLVDLTERNEAAVAAHRLAAIVESSDDAILAKDLNGVITSWNHGAERIFGYSAAEAIGKPITMLIPPERQSEEPAILARIRAGDRIEHFETIRQRKDGSKVEISLTISPVRSPSGQIIGASKIARDITERRRAQEQQKLLIREMNHRVKNLFALAGSIVSLSARSARSVTELTASVRERLVALARAHALTLSDWAEGAIVTEVSTTLHELIKTITSPYDEVPEAGASRIVVSGCNIELAGSTVTSFALLLHEFTANAAKYGALSWPDGRIEIECSMDDERFMLEWRERDGPAVTRSSDGEGFGSLLTNITIRSQLGGELAHEWRPQGLIIRLSVARKRLQV